MILLRLKSILSRFTASRTPPGRPAPPPDTAARAKAASLDRTPTDNESTLLEILQLVHDLRNQLTIMTLAADDITDIRPDVRESRLRELQGAVGRSVQLIDALLRSERSSSRRRLSDDANEVVRRTTSTLSQASSEAIRVQLHLWPAPLPVFADAGELDRVLLNLMLNGCDAMPKGGVLTIETGMTDDRPANDARAAGPSVRIVIRDTGTGMTAAVQERIFDPFFTTKKGGTGLGLRSVAFTVEQLEGQISVESEPGRGTAVTLLLPLAEGASG
jgi:signal transduction histidine kinase